MVNTILAKRVNHIVAKGDNPACQKGQSRVAFPDTNGVDFGWQGGISAAYSMFVFKVGYEFGFCNMVQDIDSKSGDFFFRIGLRF